MPYTPAYNALFAKPLLNQLIAIIQRDQTAAINIVNPSLAPISEFHKGPGTFTAFPRLTLRGEGVRFDQESSSTRHQLAQISLALDSGQFDQEMAQDNAQDYARVLDIIITTAPISDFTTSLPIVNETVPSGLTSPGAPNTVKEIFVESHQYALVTLQNIDTPVLRVTLTLVFDLEET